METQQIIVVVTMRILTSILTLIFGLFLIAYAEGEQNGENNMSDWKRLEATIQMLEKDLETDEKIQENIKEMNNMILEGLRTIDENAGKNAKVSFKIAEGKYLIMEIHPVSKFPVSRIVTEEELQDTGGQIQAEDGNDIAGNSLSKVIFALASVLYVAYSAYLLFLVGYNIRYGNYLSTFLDFGIWLVATAIMYELYRGLL